MSGLTVGGGSATPQGFGDGSLPTSCQLWVGGGRLLMTNCFLLGLCVLDVLNCLSVKRATRIYLALLIAGFVVQHSTRGSEVLTEGEARICIK